MRTTFFYKGCPLRCPWCSNPESIAREPELYHVAGKCVGCGECARACPGQAIAMRGGGGPAIDRGRCRRCFACVAACPTMALVVKGESLTPEEMVGLALRDRAFYEESGGGVAISGGEPLLQSDAAAAFLRSAKLSGLHTAMETCGLAPRSALERVLPHLDLVYMDLKHPDPVRHREIVGAPGDLVLDNLRFLAREKRDFIVRIPFVPGYNLDPETVREYARLLAPLGIRVEPLPFHQFGKNKYASVGREYALRDQKPLGEGDIAGALATLADAGIDVVK
jgi:pyruvate formate lyase activating enzyme